MTASVTALEQLLKCRHAATTKVTDGIGPHSRVKNMKSHHIRTFLATAVLAAMLASASHAQDGNAEQMLQLASEGETKSALELLGRNTDVNQSQSDGTTLLHWAIYYNDLDLVKQLLRRDADVNARNEYGATPLSQAAITGNPEILQELLDAGVDVNERGADDQTALMIIARTNNLAAANVLIKAGADVNAVEQWRGQTALMWAAAQQQPEMVKLLIEKGADVDARSLPNNWERQV